MKFVRLLGSLALLAPLLAGAAVKEAREGLIELESTASTSATPAATYAALIKVASWWDSSHTWSGAAKNLKLDARAGGCFCERLPGGGSVEHGRIVFAQPGKLLRLQAALGPLQNMAVTGILTFSLAAEGSGTKITLTYRVSGAFPMDPSKLGPGVDGVLSGQLARLQRYTQGKTP